MSDSGERALRRDIGVALAVLVVINSTIGTGIFKTPARAARLTGSLGVALGVWLVGALIALCGALTLAELAAAIPRAGGLYEYLQRAWGKRVGFLLGWVKLTLLIPSATGSFAKLSAESLAAALGLAPNPARDARVAMMTLLACAAVNSLAVGAATRAQGAITVLKYAGVLALAVLGLALPVHGTVGVPADLPAVAAGPTLLGALAALVGVMWAYDGWADLASLAGEVKDPDRNLPKAFALGTLAIAAVYLLANLGYARALGLEGLQRSTTGANMAAANVAALTLGAPGRTALSALVWLSCVGGCMSSLLTGSRVFVPMAADGVFFRRIGVVDERTGVPLRAVAIGAILGCGYVLSRTFEQLTEAFVVGLFPFYALAVGAVFVLRRREPSLARPFRVPGYPWVPVVFLLGAAVLMVGALASADSSTLHALGVLAVGAVLSLFVHRR
ncbi:MAG: amino acid permease [Polyangiales bacterium]